MGDDAGPHQRRRTEHGRAQARRGRRDPSWRRASVSGVDHRVPRIVLDPFGRPGGRGRQQQQFAVANSVVVQACCRVEPLIGPRAIDATVAPRPPRLLRAGRGRRSTALARRPAFPSVGRDPRCGARAESIACTADQASHHPPFDASALTVARSSRMVAQQFRGLWMERNREAQRLSDDGFLP